MKLLIIVLAAYGMTFGWIEGSFPLIKYARKIACKIHENLATCYHCVGTWAGLISFMLYEYGGKAGKSVVSILAVGAAVMIIEQVMVLMYNCAGHINNKE